MTNVNRIVLKTSSNGVSPTGFNQQSAVAAMAKVNDLTGRCACGGCDSNMQLSYNPVSAVGLLTGSANVTTSDTVHVGNQLVTFIVSTGTPSAHQVKCGTTLNDSITNLIAELNADTVISPWITASASGLSTVALTANMPGIQGNAFQLSSSSGNLIATAFSGGTEGTIQTYSIGL